MWNRTVNRGNRVYVITRSLWSLILSEFLLIPEKAQKKTKKIYLTERIQAVLHLKTKRKKRKTNKNKMIWFHEGQLHQQIYFCNDLFSKSSDCPGERQWLSRRHTDTHTHTLANTQEHRHSHRPTTEHRHARTHDYRHTQTYTNTHAYFSLVSSVATSFQIYDINKDSGFPDICWGISFSHTHTTTNSNTWLQIQTRYTTQYPCRLTQWPETCH